jgi:uncharacterized protein YnzC (UPF0291/DUF896 family)
MSKEKSKGLTEEEFNKLKGLNEAYITAKSRVGDAALFHKRSVDILDATERNLQNLQDELVAKYGEVSIDATNGMFK